MSDKLRKQYRFSTVPEHLIHDATVSDRAFRLWCILDRYAGKDEAAFPLRDTLADDLSCSRATVDRAIGELVDGGWLHKERRWAGGSNLYTLLIAPASSKAKKAEVKTDSVLTDEDTPPVLTDEDTPHLTGEDTLASPVSRPVITGDAHKEASLSEHQVTETSDDSLRSSSAPDVDQPALDGMPDGASSTPAIDKPDEHPGDAVARWWWEHLDPKPITTSKREAPFKHIERLCRAGVDRGYTRRQVADALVAIGKAKPTVGEFDDRLRQMSNGVIPINRRGGGYAVHHAPADSPDAIERRTLLGGS